MTFDYSPTFVSIPSTTSFIKRPRLRPSRTPCRVFPRTSVRCTATRLPTPVATKPEIVPEQTNSNRWPCTVASAIIHALHSTAIYVAPSVLVSPIRQSLNLSVEQAILPLIAFRTVQTVFLLPAGYLLDKIGPQRCLRFSLIMACILAPLLPFATSLSQLIILQSVAALTKLMGGVSALLLLASLNFPSGKGLPTATSMLISGYSFAGFLAPAVIGVVSQQFGWRIALGALSALFAVVTVPATLVFLKEPDNRYRKKSLSQIFTEIPVVKRLQSFFTTFGKEDHSHLSSHSNARVALAARQKSDSEDEKLLTTGLVSTLVMVVAYSFAMHLVFDHLIVFLTEDIGIAFNVATRYMSVLNLVALGTKLVLGPIAERVNKTKLLMGAGVLGVFASLLLFDVSLGTIVVTASLPKIMVFSVLFAIAYASVYSLTTMFLPEFGKKKLGMRTNLNMMLCFGSGSVASYVAGMLRSTSGSYKWAFACNIVSFLVVIAAALFKHVWCDNGNLEIARDARRIEGKMA